MKRILSVLLAAVLVLGIALPVFAVEGDTAELAGTVKASGLPQAERYYIKDNTTLELDRDVSMNTLDSVGSSVLTVKGSGTLTVKDLTCTELILESGTVHITGRLLVTGQLTIKGGAFRADGRLMADYLLLQGGVLEAPGGMRLFAGYAQSGGEADADMTQCDGNLTISGGSLTVTASQGIALTCAKEITLTGGSLTAQFLPPKTDEVADQTDPSDDADYDVTNTVPVYVLTYPGIQTALFTMIGGELNAEGSPAIRAQKRLAIYTPAAITQPTDGKPVKVTDPADQSAGTWYVIQGGDGVAAEVVKASAGQNSFRFTDVPETCYYRIPVAWAVSAGISNGTSKTTYSPHQSVTRALVVNFLWKYAGSPEPKSLKTGFTDVNEKTFGYKAILWAVEQKIIQGVTTNQFKPDGLCSRELTILILHRFFGSPKPQSTNSPFRDVKMNTSTTGAVLWAIENGITVGTTPTTFSPDTTCTRAMLTTFLYRLDRRS